MMTDASEHTWDKDEWEVVANAISEDEKLLSSIAPIDTHQLLLTLNGSRPGCMVSTRSIYESQAIAEGVASTPELYTAGDPVHRFLTEFDIPWELNISLSQAQEKDVFIVEGGYFISLDEARLRQRDGVFSDLWESNSSEEYHRSLGQFLGYPECVTDAWLPWNSHEGDTLFDQLSEQEVEERLGEFGIIIEKLDVESTLFAEYLLPYTVPATVTQNCIEKVFDDLRHSITLLGVLLMEDHHELVARILGGYEYMVGDMKRRRNGELGEPVS